MQITEHDNLIEYTEPFAYDIENPDFEPDGPFYLSLAQRFSGDALELGCGTGRVTIPMAQAGIKITGLDTVPGMLERAKVKAGDLPVQWVEADIRRFDLGKQFKFIFETGAVFQHMLERPDQEAALARVWKHLEPDGYFVVGTMFPSASMIGTEPEADWFSYVDEHGREVRVSGKQDYDPLTQVRTETAFRRWKTADGQEVVKEYPLRLRCFFPQEIEALLHYNGFAIRERYGDTDFSPLTHESGHMIYVCQPAG
jgi:SAM-dependent methyltransferase